MHDLLELTQNLKWKQVPDRAVAIFKKHSKQIAQEWIKEAESPTLHRLAQLMNITKGEYPGGIPNAPSPLASMLVSGLAGAGIGYGLGWLGEKVLPRKWNRGNLRTTGALGGAALGASPGALWGLANALEGRQFNDNTLWQSPPVKRKPRIHHELADFLHFENNPYEVGGSKLASDVKDEIRTSFDKVAAITGLGFDPIPVDEFNRVIWNDPRVANPLTPATRAAATGLVTGAANLPGKRDARFVTPLDVGRMAAGMGSGYVSGALVGKALGVMMGMPDSTQEHLKNTGMWAGLVSNLVPIAFGA